MKAETGTFQFIHSIDEADAMVRYIVITDRDQRPAKHLLRRRVDVRGFASGQAIDYALEADGSVSAVLACYRRA